MTDDGYEQQVFAKVPVALRMKPLLARVTLQDLILAKEMFDVFLAEVTFLHRFCSLTTNDLQTIQAVRAHERLLREERCRRWEEVLFVGDDRLSAIAFDTRRTQPVLTANRSTILGLRVKTLDVEVSSAIGTRDVSRRRKTTDGA